MNARGSHFTQELERAHQRWQSKPNLGDCKATLKEKADVELCIAAQGALDKLGAVGDAADQALPTLAAAALALARFSERVRFLSLAELSQKRLLHDGGAPGPTPQTAPRPSPSAKWPNRALHDLKRPFDRESFELGDGPISKMMGTTVHAERDVVRALGAYLEYAELPVRRGALVTVKNLRDEHPQWPLLAHLLREASLLESDPDLKRELQELSASGLPRGAGPGHSPDSK